MQKRHIPSECPAQAGPPGVSQTPLEFRFPLFCCPLSLQGQLSCPLCGFLLLHCLFNVGVPGFHTCHYLPWAMLSTLRVSVGYGGKWPSSWAFQGEEPGQPGTASAYMVQLAWKWERSSAGKAPASGASRGSRGTVGLYPEDTARPGRIPSEQ